VGVRPPSPGAKGNCQDVVPAAGAFRAARQPIVEEHGRNRYADGATTGLIVDKEIGE
jgi:hypothetical protein